MIRESIQQALAEAAGVAPSDVLLEHPADPSHGDYATNLALMLSKERNKSPKDLAEEIVKNLSAIEGVLKVGVAGPGFINITLTREVFSGAIEKIVQEKEVWGRNNLLGGKRVVVEYSQPNPFKPFHIGHLMSTTIGESISRLVENAGAHTYRANYQGDIGPHVAKCLWGLEKVGGDPSDVSVLQKAYVEGNEAYESNPSAKAEIDEINQRLYKGDKELEPIYDAGRKASLEKFEEIYKVLGTRFDHYFFESETGPVGVALVEEGKKKGIFEESDGAVVYRGEEQGLHTRVFITSKGTPTYEAKELGLAKMKYDFFPYDLNITTVAVEQDGYFRVVRRVLEDLLPDIGRAYTHIPHGMMQLQSGKMSSRKGNVITGESLIEEVRQDAREKMEGRGLDDEEKETVAISVGVAAIKYMVLKQKLGKNIVFDTEQSLSFEGDSGPYLQYSYVRAHSVLLRAYSVPADGRQAAHSAPDSMPLFERLLPRFEGVVERATNEREPHHITTYLTELASEFNSWYAEVRIIGSEHEAYHLLLVEAFLATMKNGLWLLGIDAPDKM
jgi:arginyl-tRNA synthetase